MKNYKKALRILSKCNGDCKHCARAQLASGEVNEHLTVFAVYCDAHPAVQPYSNSLSDLRRATLDALRYEFGEVTQ